MPQTANADLSAQYVADKDFRPVLSRTNRPCEQCIRHRGVLVVTVDPGQVCITHTLV